MAREMAPTFRPQLRRGVRIAPADQGRWQVRWDFDEVAFLTGESCARVVAWLAPELDGRRTIAELQEQANRNGQQEDLLAVLECLCEEGFLSDADRDGREDTELASALELLQGETESVLDRLKQTHVVVCGRSPLAERVAESARAQGMCHTDMVSDQKSIADIISCESDAINVLPVVIEPDWLPDVLDSVNTWALAANMPWMLIAGLCEVIERDAVALAWIGQIQPPRINVRDRKLSDDVETIIEMLNQRGLRWAAFDLTTDAGVPVIAALVQGESPVGSIVSFGSACHPNAQRALLKALIEAVHCRMYVKSLIRREPLWKAGRGFRSVTSFADHARFYSVHGEYRQRLERWWSSTRSVDCRDASAQPPVEWLRKQVETLAGAGYETLVIDLTPPDVVHLGLHVVRVLLPGFQPLHGNHHWAHLGGDRLGRLSSVFGPHVSQPRRWNRYPHPCA